MPDDLLTFDTPTSAVFEVNTEARTIKGLALPYGKIGSNGQGRYSFAQGTLQWPADLSRVKLLVGHDFASAVGYATAVEDTAEGPVATFKVARGAEGDRALSMAQDKVWDGLSVGIGQAAKFSLSDGVLHAKHAPVAEVSLTPLPAFEDARVRSVAASAATNPKEALMGDEITPEETPEGGVTLADNQDLTVTLTQAIRDGFASIANQARPSAPAAGLPVAHINEASPYRFDGTRGTYDFSTDLINGIKNHDSEAMTRVMGFMEAEMGLQFVQSGDTSALNPKGYRGDMFVNEQRYGTPLYDAFYKGALTDITPFSFSKFNEGDNFVNDHTEGVEPSTANYSTATSATITPAPVSGKIKITREVWDQGGNPQVSALLWSKAQYEYRKAMEMKVAALLAAATPNEFTATALAAGASTVANLAAPIEQGIARLNFIAGGQRYNYTAAHLDLYLALTALKDGNQRPYFPILNPQNANGTTNAGYHSIGVAGMKVDPVWSLGTVSDGNAHKSYIADTSAVWFWATAPNRLDLVQAEVANVYIGIWGYQAGVIQDPTGLLKVTYDPTA